MQAYHQLWTRYERKAEIACTNESEEGSAGALAQSIADLSLSECKGPTKASKTCSVSKSRTFWELTPCIFRATLHLSKLYAHSGLLLEAQYYLDECEKLAASASSPYLLAPCLALKGRFSILGGDREQGLRFLREAENIIKDAPMDLPQISIYQSLAYSFLKGEQQKIGLSMNEAALQRAEKLATRNMLLHLTYDGNLQSTTKKGQTAIARRGEKVNRSGRKANTGPKRPAKGTVFPAFSDADQNDDSLPLADSIPLQISRRKIVHRMALGHLSQNSPDVAASLLEDIRSSPIQRQEVIDQAFLWARVHVCQALKALAEDPILSVITESTICSPAAGGPSIQNNSSSSLRKPSTQAAKPHGKRSNKGRDIVDNISPDDSSQSLSLAQQNLNEVFDMAKVLSSTKSIHMLTAFLGKIVMTLCVLSGSQSDSKSRLLHYFLGACLLVFDCEMLIKDYRTRKNACLMSRISMYKRRAIHE